MSFFHSVLLVAAAVAASISFGQSIPTQTRPLPSGTLVSAETAVSIDLKNYFALPDVAGQVVQFNTVLGKFNVELLSNAAPQNAANFLNYVNAGAYTNSFFHRAVSFDSGADAIVQGGGYTWVGAQPTTIPRFNPVPLEYSVPNSRGTLAAARTSEVNSATSEWYFNVRDNSTILGPANGGGYTVFGRVIGTGMTVVDAIAELNEVNGGGVFADLPVRNFSGGTLTSAHLASITSVTAVPVYPTGQGTSVIAFTGGNSAPTIVNATLSGSTLTLTPLAAGSAIVTIRATDTNSNVVEATMGVTVPQPFSRSVTLGTTAVFGANTGASAYQWQRNGVDLNGATASTLTITGVEPAHAGLYAARMTTTTGTSLSRQAVLGMNSTVKQIGTGTEYPNIFHAGTGYTYDQIRLEGAAISAKADASQILRISYIDQTNDIVQVEFSGPGTLTLVLDSPTGPAAPQNYNQDIAYTKGHAGIIVTGASADTHLTVFSVGRAILGTNPALYRDDVTYDGMADIAFIAITTTDGSFGGVRAANTRFSASKGLTGVYAPDVAFTGPVFVGDIIASAEAEPVLSIGAGSDVRITGGDLYQPNGRDVRVSGITQLKFMAGSTSHGTLQNAQVNLGRLVRNGVDVTGQITVYP